MSNRESTPGVPEERLEKQFSDYKPLMSKHEALAEAERCLYCVDAPCIDSCPTNIDIPEFIRRIATGNVAGSAETILEQNILGLSCAQVCPTEVLCQSTCVYNEMEEPPIEIGRLQHYATEHAYERDLHFFEAGEPTGKSVGIIGAGPAGVACAHEVRKRGHEAVIYEATAYPGGLNTDGVAPYKFQADDSIREIEYVTDIGGITVEYDTAVGRDVSLGELEEEHDAIFVGVGLGPDRWLPVEGSDLDGVIGAVDFIEALKTEENFELPDNLERVAVVGGGNTAIDVVREMRGLGVEDVMLVYRRDAESMSGYDHEWAGAKNVGARGIWRSQPVEILGEDRVRGLRCRKTREVKADGGGSDLEVVEGTEFDIECDAVILAIGQSKLGELFEDVDGVQLEWGRIVVDPETGETGNPKYFAGGDCANGGKEVVNAVQEAKIAAGTIDERIR